MKKYQFKYTSPSIEVQEKLERFIVYLYENGLTAEEIAKLRWRHVDEYADSPLVTVQRSTLGVKYNKTIEISGPLAIWLKNSPIYGPYLFYRYCPHGKRNSTREFPDGVLYTAQEIEQMVTELQTKNKMVGALVPAV